MIASDPTSADVTAELRQRANRKNASHSTGPRTDEGKTRSRLNAMKHGLCAQEPWLGPEDRRTFAVFEQELQDSYRPMGVLQLDLFRQLAFVQWKLMRCNDIQRELYERLKQEDDEPACRVIARGYMGERPGAMERAANYELRLRGQWLKMIRLFQELKQKQAGLNLPEPWERESSRPAEVAERTQSQESVKPEQVEAEEEVATADRPAERSEAPVERASDASDHGWTDPPHRAARPSDASDAVEVPRRRSD
jgi:hypothetical protein